MKKNKYVSDEICNIISQLLDEIDKNPQMSSQRLSDIQDEIASFKEQARKNGEEFPYYIAGGF